jgi:hypothetical protein
MMGQRYEEVRKKTNKRRKICEFARNIVLLQTSGVHNMPPVNLNNKTRNGYY